MRLRTSALTLCCLLIASRAHASGDYLCEPRIRPASDQYSACDNTALLAPGNDTRVNLTLLLADRHDTPVGRFLPEVSPKENPPQIVPFRWDDLPSRSSPPLKPDESAVTDSVFSLGEGTVCVSDVSGRDGFIAAVNAESSLGGDERKHLVDARTALACQADGTPPGSASVDTGALRSPAGREFGQYLDSIAAFYAGTYDAAAFETLSRSRQAWVREAATYMIARTWALRGQQTGFGEFGEIDRTKMDRAAFDKASDALGAYLKAYPKGRYAASARGLMRRVHWLAGDFDALAADYRWQIEQTDAAQRNLGDIDLAVEIDAKFPADAYARASVPPLMLAVDDLRRMRRDGVAADGSPVPTMTRKELEAQKSRFSREPALFQYLLAAYAYFVEHKPDAVLTILPADDARKPFDTLGFSRQLLRALALEDTHAAQARSALASLLPRATLPHQRQTVEIAIAMHDERANALGTVFAKDSPVRDGRLRERLIATVADADLLRTRVRDAGVSSHEGAVALYILLYKSLSRGRYNDFIADLKGLPSGKLESAGQWSKIEDAVALADFRWEGTRDGYRCPSLVQIATSLAKTPQANGPRLCLGEFLRLNAYDHTSLDQAPPSDELGGTPSLFSGKPLVRMDIYKAVIDDPAASADDKAYALYRAVYCYAPSGNNDCGGEDVPIATRKGWYNRLKSQYPKSSWAQNLQYYW